MYEPSHPPHDQRAAIEWMLSELIRVAQALSESDGITFKKLYAAPDKVYDGLVVYADGTSWNPGSGAGWYGYNGSAWVKLG